LVTSPLWAQELSFERLLEIAPSYTDRQQASFLPERVSGLCLPILAMSSQLYSLPFGIPLSSHSTVFIVRRRQLRGLTESADQLLERFVLRFRLARLMTGAQDCHGWAFKVGSNGPLEVQEGDEGEAILSSAMVAPSHKSGSMRSFLDIETNREREGRASESQTGSLDKVQSWLKFGYP
jgi:hypothetical protein